MRKILVVLIMAGLLVLALSVPALAWNENAYWGQVTQTYAQVYDPGTLGEHASQQETPRLGLRNLARDLYGADGSMQDLAELVNGLLGLGVYPD